MIDIHSLMLAINKDAGPNVAVTALADDDGMIFSLKWLVGDASSLPDFRIHIHLELLRKESVEKVLSVIRGRYPMVEWAPQMQWRERVV